MRSMRPKKTGLKTRMGEDDQTWKQQRGQIEQHTVIYNITRRERNRASDKRDVIAKVGRQLIALIACNKEKEIVSIIIITGFLSRESSWFFQSTRMGMIL